MVSNLGASVGEAILLLVAVAFGASLGFDEAVRTALVDAPAGAIAEAEARREIAEARAGAAWEGNPAIEGEHRPGETALVLTVPIEAGGLARAGAVRPAVDAARARRDAGRAAVAAAAGAAWLDARRAWEHAAAWSSVSDRALALSTAGDARLRSGEWSAGEAALLRADAARLLDRALTAGQQARSAARVLAALLGRTEAEELGEWPDLPEPPEVVAAAVPAVLAAGLDARAAVARARAADVARLPNLEVGGGWSFGDTPGAIGVLSLELPLFATRGAPAIAAHADADAAAALRRRAEADAEALLASARDEFDVARRIAAFWSEVDIAAAVDAVDRRFATGEIALHGYLQERDLVVAARTDAIDARWRNLRANLALWELAGRSPVEVSR